MSFIYAIKHSIENDGQTYKYTNVYSDTKTLLYGASKLNWGEKNT